MFSTNETSAQSVLSRSQDQIPDTRYQEARSASWNLNSREEISDFKEQISVWDLKSNNNCLQKTSCRLSCRLHLDLVISHQFGSTAVLKSQDIWFWNLKSVWQIPKPEQIPDPKAISGQKSQNLEVRGRSQNQSRYQIPRLFTSRFLFMKTDIYFIADIS